MRAQGLSAMRSGGLMKPRLFVQFLVVAMMGFLSGTLSAQAPKKFVFVNSVEGSAPPATNSPVFAVPAGVAIGPDETVYVADPQHNQVVASHPNGSTQFFNSLPCPSTVAGCAAGPWMLQGPTYVAVAPNGNVWISDTMNDVVVEVNPTGTVVAFAGAGPHYTVCGSTFGIGCSGPPPHPNAGQGPGQFYGPGPLAVDKLGNV
jgi:DNA-binding beta-propeller fold protein YncE